MKMLKRVYILVMMTLFLLPFVSFSFASDKVEARYGGLNNNEIFVYLTTFNKKPLEKFYEKEWLYYGIDEETAKKWAEEEAEDIFDHLDYDKDIEAIKYYISKVENDREDVGNYYGRKAWYNKYISEDRDANEWELSNHESYIHIIEYQENRYEHYYMPGAYYYDVPPVPFIAKGVEWNHLASRIDNKLDDISDMNAGAKKLNDGIQIYFKFKFGSSSIETEKFRSTSRYTSKGVLYYYEWTYHNEIIAKFELEQSFYSEFWLLLLIISVIAGAIFVIILKHELKQ